MRKGQMIFSSFVVILTAVNVMLWLGLVHSGPVPRSGRILAFIIMLALSALFAHKTSNNPYVPGFIRITCLLALMVLFFVLLSQ